MKNYLKRIATITAMTTLALAYSQSAAAQESKQITDELKALKEEMKSIREGQQAMQHEMQQLKELLQARLAAPQVPSQPTIISIADEPTLGNKDASIVLVDFSDYQCPFCGKFVLETMPQLVHDYIQTGKIKYVFRDLPLESMHPNAFEAALAAHCAGEEGKYWEMHNRLYFNQAALDTNNLPMHAQALGLDMTKFTQCLKSERYAAKVRNNMSDAENAGIQVTPSFIVGLASQDHNDQNVKVLKLITGAQPYSAFKAALDNALAAAR